MEHYDALSNNDAAFCVARITGVLVIIKIKL